MTQIEAVIFDWAGTLVDFGSRAPMGAFVQAFASFGVTITLDEARAPMGRAKRDHIRAILAAPRVAQVWADARGTKPDEAAIDAVYDVFLPLNIDTAAAHATAIPGAADVVTELRAKGIRLGSTTGYTRSIMDRVLPVAAGQGLVLDHVLCCDEVPAGRPSGAGMFRNFVALNVSAAHLCLKLDDTPVGMAEGRNGGAWCVGLTLSGNETGLSPEELAALSPEDRSLARDRAAEVLQAAGAHYTIDSVADLPRILPLIEARIAAGERP